jgi:hypothetical protein
MKIIGVTPGMEYILAGSKTEVVALADLGRGLLEREEIVNGLADLDRKRAERHAAEKTLVAFPAATRPETDGTDEAVQTKPPAHARVSKPRKNGRKVFQVLEKLPCRICGKVFQRTNHIGRAPTTCSEACKRELKRKQDNAYNAAKRGQKPNGGRGFPPMQFGKTAAEAAPEIPPKLVKTIAGMMQAERISAGEAINRVRELWKTAGKTFPVVTNAALAAAVEAET